MPARAVSLFSIARASVFPLGDEQFELTRVGNQDMALRHLPTTTGQRKLRVWKRRQPRAAGLLSQVT